MKKTNKRTLLLSVVIAGLILASSVFGADILSALAGTGIFSDSFTSADLTGWNSAEVGKVNSGKYYLSGQEKNSITGISDRLNLKISANTTVNIGADESGLIQNSVASLVVCGNKDLTTGYEFSVGVSKAGTTYARLYLRGNDKTSRILVQKANNIAGVDGGVLKAGQEYSLSIGVYEGLIQCFVNDELAISFADSTYTSGYCGVKTSWSNSIFDNVAVEKIEDKKVSKIEIPNPPKKLSLLGELTFDAVVTYEGKYHQPETFKANDSRLTVTGFDRSIGAKNVTVSYGGKSASFPLNVVETTKDRVVFTDKFDEWNGKDWKTSGTKIQGDAVQYKGIVGNGQLNIHVPPLPAGFNSAATGAATLLNDKAKNLDLFYVSVDAVIGEDIKTAKTRTAIAGISTLVDATGKDYSLRVNGSGYIQLYNGSTLIYQKKISGISGLKFERNKKFKLTMCIGENVIICKYNNKDVFYYTGADMKNCTPKITLRAWSGDVSFDNFRLYTMERYSTDAVKSIQVMTVTSNEATNSYTGRRLDPSQFYLMVTYIDGSTRAVGITEDMLLNYNPDVKAKQNVIFQYGKTQVPFVFNYSQHLFYENFDGAINPLWSISDVKDLKSSVENGKLKTKWNGKIDEATVSSLVTGGEEWVNYSVEADVAFDQDMSKHIKSSSYYSLVLRRTGKTYYDYRMITRAGNISLSLRMYKDGVNKEVANVSNSVLQSKLSGTKVVSNGTIFNLKAMCKGDTIYMYVDDILMSTYTDASPDAPQKGTAGLKCSRISGTVDNFIVEEKGPLNIVKIDVQGVKDNLFEIYEGFEIEPYDYWISCYDADGTVFTEMMQEEMISPYDNLETGVQNITITAHGLKANAQVHVKERNDFIQEIDKELCKLNVKKLTSSDKEHVKHVLECYDELSGYETTKLSKKAVKKAVAARKKMEVLLYPELEMEKLLYTNTFSTGEDCDADEWSSGNTSKKGEWKFSNGTYRLEQKYYDISTSSYRMLQSIYGEITSVNARFKLLAGNMYAGVGLNYNSEGSYIARVKMDYYDEAGKVIPMFQVIRNDVRLYSEALSAHNMTLGEDEWFEVRLIYVDGVVSAYLNDKLMYSFDDKEMIGSQTEGYPVLTLANGNGVFDNVTVYGVKKELPKSDAKPTPTEYKDDFEDEPQGQNPNYWTEDNVSDDWKVYASGENNYYAAVGNKGETNTWLHVFEKDPTVNLDFKFKSESNGANGGFYIRCAPETAYVRVGYDSVTQKWYIKETQGERDADINTTYSDVTYKMDEEWHHIEITAKDRFVTVSVDGTEVLKDVKVTQYGYGRIGAFTNGATLCIDNVDLQFPNGDLPIDGVLDYTMYNGGYSGSLDLQGLDGDNMVAFGVYEALYSKDGGRSFELVGGTNNLISEDKVKEPYLSMATIRGYRTIMELHDGSIIYTCQSDFVVKRTTDGGKTWQDIGRIMPEDEITDERGRKNKLFHNNAFTEVQLEDGTWRVFLPMVISTYNSHLSTGANGHYTLVYYSDDGGVTWKTSENDTRDVLIDYKDGVQKEWAESKIIKGSDGVLRMYLTRAKYGCMQYTESHDGGITWEGHYQIPEMQTAKSSYSLIHDTSNPGTYYLVWVNNAPVYQGATFSRTRLSLARSTDGKTWTYLGDMERMTEEVYGNDVTLTTPLMQIVDPSLYVDEDYLYVTFARSDGTDPTEISGRTTNYHNSLRPRMVRIEKDKLTDRAWDASSIVNMLFPKSLEVTKPAKVRYGLGDMFSHLGGEVTVTRLDGTTEVQDTNNFYLYEEPDMFMLGKQKVVLYNIHGMQVSYEIEVVRKYNITWKVTGDGVIDPKANSVLEGDDLKATISTNSFFDKAIVRVNGERVRLQNGELVLKKVMEEQEITVDFVKKGILDYLVYIIGLLVLIGAVVIAIICFKKKIGPKELLGQMKAKLRKSETHDTK